jgi:P-type Mg2+ transporter
MKMTEFLEPTAIIDDLVGSTPQDVLTEICRPLSVKAGVDAERLVEALLAREQLARPPWEMASPSRTARSKGAMLMAGKKVIVKRLHSIQNLGAMNVLCTDKTGTLTADHVVLEKHCDVELEEDDEVLALAYLNSHFQTGLKNVLDRAVLAHTEIKEQFRVPDHRKVDEIPFDFSRRLMSVVVALPDGRHRLICKGAPEEVFRRCPYFEYGGEQLPMEAVLIDDLRLEYEKLSADGFRVLAIACRDFDPKETYSKADEADLVLRGYVAFFDPPKDSAGPAIQALHQHGVEIKVLTGDNEAVSKKICRDVGIPMGKVLLGAQVETMSESERLPPIQLSATAPDRYFLVCTRMPYTQASRSRSLLL